MACCACAVVTNNVMAINRKTNFMVAAPLSYNPVKMSEMTKLHFDFLCFLSFFAASSSSTERNLQPELNVAAGSRTDERIAGRDVGCGAPAAENLGGPHVILCTRATIVSRCAVRIEDEGVIEQIKELARNWALNRSLNVKFLNTEKSTFLKPESRKMFRPMVP